MDLFHPALLPFTAALIVLGLIAALELVGLLFGVAFSNLVDSALPEFELDADADFEINAELSASGGPLDVDGPDVPDMPSVGPLSQFLSWLCVGKVPVLILLAAWAKARLILLWYLELADVPGWRGGILLTLALFVAFLLTLYLAAWRAVTA